MKKGNNNFKKVMGALVGFITVFYSHLIAHTMPDYNGMVFPPDHALNMQIDSLPVHPNSDNYIKSIGNSTSLHPDFGTEWENQPIGIPYNLVGKDQPKAPITFDYDDESDTGPWPIPQNPLIETVFDWREQAEGDRHLLIIDTSNAKLYEAYYVFGNASGTQWTAGSGAIFDLKGYTLRPADWTSADAAGLPIFPLLIRYDEVERALSSDGIIHHAIRFTAAKTQKAYIWPARHYASNYTDKNLPPMGLRVRLKKDFDISGFTPRIQVILRTMKKYGLILADNGSNWYFQGTHDDRWDDEELNSLKRLTGINFEAVDITPWMERPGFDINSARVPPSSSTLQKEKMPFHFSWKDEKIKKLVNLNDFQISFYSKLTGESLIEVFDITGKKIRNISYNISKTGIQKVTLTKDKYLHRNSFYLIRVTVISPIPK